MPALIAFLAVLLWLLHPLQTNAVTYIVQRMASMAAMFYILSMLFYVRGRLLMRAGRTRKSVLFFAGCLLSGLGAVASKENAAMLPVFILIYEWFFFQDLRLIKPKPMLAGAILSVLILGSLAYVFLGSNPLPRLMAGFHQWDFTLAERVLTEFRVVIFYLGLLVFPHPARLMLDYDFPLSHSLINPPTTLLSVLGVALMIILIGYTARTHRVLAFALLWFLGNLVIESSVIPIELIYEHRLYLPSMMIFLAVVDTVYRKFNFKRSAVAGIVLVALVFGFWTFQRNAVWTNDVRFWRDAALKAPGDARPLQNLAYALQQNGRDSEAIHYYQKSLEMSEKPATWYNMGLSFSETKQHVEAISALRKAIEKNYDPSMAYAKLGYEFTMVGEFNAAMENYRKAVEKDPDNNAARQDLQRLVQFLRQCRTPQACVQALSAQHPENAALQFKLGLLYEGQQEIRQAISSYETVISMTPDANRQIYTLALNHLATCLLRTGEVDRAMSLFLKGAEQTDDYRFAYQLAALHAYKNNTQESLKWLERAVADGFDDFRRLETDRRFNSVRNMTRFQIIRKTIQPAEKNLN